MATIEIVDIMQTLRSQRSLAKKELKQLDKVISALRELSSTNTTPSTNGRRRTLSAAARRKIAKAQKLRWEKFRQAKRAKA